MKGAIIGDIIGSVYEFSPIKTKAFELFYDKSEYTDDTVCTIAVADTLINHIPYEESFNKWAEKRMERGYGSKFFRWLGSEKKEPYNSLGNGAAMRISPIGFYFDTEEEVLEEAKKCCDITHNHPEGVKAGKSVAMAIFLARNGKTKEEIKEYIEKNFQYDLSRKLDDIRPTYKFSEKSPDSVPEAIICFLESNSFEDAIRNAVSLGGDADTQACIAGGIAEAFYGLNNTLWEQAKKYLDSDMIDLVEGFYKNIEINRFGILLDDVRISREKAIERDKVSSTEDYTCPHCHSTNLEVFYACNSDDCWKGMVGVGGTCIYCHRCNAIVEFEETCVS